MKKTLLTACLLTVASSASAQTAYEVTGTLLDSLTKAPDVYATVRLLTAADGKAVRAVTTDSEGRFKLTAPAPGAYRIEAFSVGRRPVDASVCLDSLHPSADCGTLYSREADEASTLGTAEVTATKPLVRAEIDKITYSMADDPDAAGSTLLDMLRKVPMVTVDGEDNIKVKGQSGFKVYVNGKPNKMMTQNPSLIFKTYPAATVKKIEVITNPGAKYDAEGTTGVLNIVTTENTGSKGYLLTPTLTAYNSGVNGGVFAMAQAGKFTLSLNYNAGTFDGKDNIGESEVEYLHDDTNHLQNAWTKARTKGSHQYGDLEASYEFSDKDLLSVSASVMGWNGRTNSLGVSDMHAADGTLTYGYNGASHRRDSYTSVQAAADYQHTFAADRRLTLSYRYDMAPQRGKRDVTYSGFRGGAPSLLDLRTDNDERGTEHTVQADFTTPFAKLHTLSVGAKYIFRLNRSNSEDLTRPSGTEEAFVPNADYSQRFRHRSGVAAAYAEYELKVKKFSLQAGSRYERYHVRATYPAGGGTPFIANIGDWVPSLSAGWSLSDAQMLRAGYNLRISRPGISTLNPYVKHDAAESISYGNPALNSERTHNIELNYSNFGAKFSFNATLTYLFSNDMFGQYAFVKDGVINNTYNQDTHLRELSADVYLSWSFAKTSKININASGFHADYRSPSTGDHNHGWHASLFGGIEQQLPWKLTASLFGGGGTKDVDLQTNSSGWYFYSLSLSRNFLREERLSVRLSASNFIKPRTIFSGTQQTAQLVMHSSNNVNRLSFGVTLQYRFGSLKAQVKKTDRTIENTDRAAKSGGGAETGGTGR